MCDLMFRHPKKKRNWTKKICLSFFCVWERERKIMKTDGTHLFSFQFQRLYAAAAAASKQRNVNQYYSSGILTCRFNFECDFFSLSLRTRDFWLFNEGLVPFWLFFSEENCVSLELYCLAFHKRISIEIHMSQVLWLFLR